jgi:hypothetical protein
VQELEAMEEALKKATEEAHNQRVALTGGVDTKVDLMQSKSVSANKNLVNLKKKQEDQQNALLQQLEKEEKERQVELKKNQELEDKITQAEKERQEEEMLNKKRAEELKLLQQEEAA